MKICTHVLQTVGHHDKANISSLLTSHSNFKTFSELFNIFQGNRWLSSNPYFLFFHLKPGKSWPKGSHE